MLQTFDNRNKDLQININGELFHRDIAGISPFDSVVQGGDGVWEGLRLYNGRIFKLEEHLNRLRHSAQAMAFETIPSNEELTSEIAKTLQANNMNDGGTYSTDAHSRKENYKWDGSKTQPKWKYANCAC